MVHFTNPRVLFGYMGSAPIANGSASGRLVLKKPWRRETVVGWFITCDLLSKNQHIVCTSDCDHSKSVEEDAEVSNSQK